jgi:hypothetical protein
MDNRLPPAKLPVRLCAMCRHMRTRAKITLFDAQDLQSPGALKAQTEWNNNIKQRAQLEFARFQSRQPFEYEPHHYAWCAHFTQIDLVTRAEGGDSAAIEQLMRTGGAIMNPVTGELGALYELCAWHNENADCDKYEPK